MKKQLLFFSLFCLFTSHLFPQDMSFQLPPREIEELAMASPSPSVSFSQSNEWMLQLERSSYYSIEVLSQPELKLAGVRIDPHYYSPSRSRDYVSALFKNIQTLKSIPVTGLPASATIASYAWYPQKDQVLLFVREKGGIYLYTASVDEPRAVRMSNRKINATQGFKVEWLANDDFITLVVPNDRNHPPVKSPVPVGPLVQENKGKKTPSRTYQDLLKDKHDEALLDYYFTAQPLKITADGKETEIGTSAIYSHLSVSPDRNYLLMKTIQRPYSYMVPLSNFPARYFLTDTQGNECKELTETPTILPIMGYDTASPYPRRFSWRPDKPATVYWVEAQDEGNPRKNQVEYKDIVYQLSSPFDQQKEEVARTALRFFRIFWHSDDFALLVESSSATRCRKTYTFKPASAEAPVLLFDLSSDDQYNNPGEPLMVRNEFNRQVLYTRNQNQELILISDGASPEGDMPYLSAYHIGKKQNNILWRCQVPYYERVVRVTDPAKLQVVTSRESVTEPVNYLLRDLKRKKANQLTDFADPYPSLRGVTKKLIHYTREDGIKLTATMYLPEGYDQQKDGRLPVLMWAYPREYKSSADAGQVRGSRYRFTYINYGSPVFWVTRGYCILDRVEMPIVGEKAEERNDTFVKQLVMNAEAAVKAITERGIGDPERIAIGGHSYGAFMTANLLTHTHLFKAGIARSGAYNRTLTPFGFQAERRTYWEAPDVYNTMSPFMHADKLNGALLLIHGEMDNNTGTFPMQSERYYNALKGHGATVRYVVLPLESHGYSAKENILHMLWEEDEWLEMYVKGKH